MTSTDRSILARRGWLAQAPAEFRNALLAAGHEETVPANRLFNRAGETGHTLWGVVSGQVAVSSAMNGADAGPGLLFNPGDWGGYMPLFGRSRPANCRSITEVRLFQIHYMAIRRLLEDHPGWWEHLGRLAMENGLAFATVAVDLLISRSDRRLAATLLNQSGCRREGEPFVLHLSLSELGEMANLSRHPVADILAATAPARAEGWNFVFEPYFMAPYMAGSTSIGPVTARVSSSPSDIFSNLNWGAMGLFEVNNGKFGFMVDLTYMDLEASRDGFIDTIGGHQGAYQANVLLRIQEHAEAYAGVRVNDLGVSISGTGPLGQPRSASRSEQWVDPVIGMRVNLPLSRSIDLTLVTDVGGFGIGSDLTYQVWPTFGFRLSDSIRAKLGYRAIYSDYSTGSGLNAFTYDVLTHGPTLGVQFRF